MAAPVRPQPPDPASGMVQMTLEQFLAWEEAQDRRYEFVDGFVRAMTGGTLRHNAIVDNVHARLRGPARAAGCRSHFTDVGVRTPSGRSYYPDVVVRCGPFAQSDRYARSPCIIVEVTSPSTRVVDREEKLGQYQTIPSLRAYVIVEQAVRRMECYVRQDDAAWTHFEASDATGVTEFAPPCVDAVLTLGDVYADTDIPPPPPDLIDPDVPPATFGPPTA
ncbi:hypothetical protein tb265_30420 [Gemmatimonadetes bacterium T265]|nr:hypothetical protein tb265_30420 [Gemmatimonadetes bacterium T265]